MPAASRRILDHPWLSQPGWRRRGVVAGGVAALLLVVVAGAWAARGPFFFMSCSLDDLSPRGDLQSIELIDRNGARLGTVAAERNRDPVPLEQIAPVMRKAIVAIEDRRFYDHGGIDVLAVFRAAFADVSEGEIVQGGSTLTQQLVRTLYIGREQTLGRKLREGCLAVELDRKLSKDEILERYLNNVYFGHRAYGIEAAAHTYFGKPAAKLELHEAALLAGMPKAPSAYDAFAHPEQAALRRGEVLAAMREAGHIDERELAQNRSRSLDLAPGKARTTQSRRYLSDFVLDRLVERYGSETVRRGGFRVRLTIDRRLQQLAEKAIAGVLDRKDDPAAAIVAIDPATGAIRALAAAAPGEASLSFNLAVDGARQAGSTFKSFVLAEAARRGINPWSTKYLSAPFAGPGNWKVETYDGDYVGRTPIAAATLRSDNTVYARLTVDVGPGKVATLAQRMGITSTVPQVPSVGLGTASVSVLDLTSAYATFAAEGVWREPRLLTKVTLPDGRTQAFTEDGEERRALERDAARVVTKVLAANVASGTGTAAGIGRPAAGKTGTTDDYADAWFAGYTPQLAAAVWVGYPGKRKPMKDVRGIAVTGGTFPAEIWKAFMGPAVEPLPAKGFADVAGGDFLDRWCGRFQFARTAEQARPANECPEPKPKPEPPLTDNVPTGPAPTAPAPTEPAPTQPAPTQPAPTQPAPTQPEPTEPMPTEPTPTQPAPAETEPDAAAAVGKSGTVVERIVGSEQRGVVEVNGLRYRARRADDPAGNVPAGTPVRVVDSDGEWALVQVE